MSRKCHRCDGDGKAHGSDRPFEWIPERGFPGPCSVCNGSGIESDEQYVPDGHYIIVEDLDGDRLVEKDRD